MGIYVFVKESFFYVVDAYITWILFLAVMSLKAARDAGRLPTVTARLALPVIAVGYLADVAFNLVSSAIFLELPREWLFTARVERHLRAGTWRGALSVWFCRVLLDPFQVGGHCK